MQVEGGGIDARTGGSPVQQTPEGRVSVVPQGEGATVTVEDFMSPTLLDRLAATPQGGGVRAEVADWRAMVDHIQIDPDHDGEVFRVRVADHPVRHTDLVAGTYTLDRIGGMVAIRVTDMLGDDWTVTWTRD